MAVSRRKFIRVLGGGAIGAALAGGALYGCDRMPESAVAPWQGPGMETDPRRRALAWALLAPNPHNMQPWLVDLRREGEILLHVDRMRLLPETDPFMRQIVIGHGTFLELLVLAAGAEGYDCVIDHFPLGQPGEEELDDRPLAHIRLIKAEVTAADPLFAQIPQRRSTKEPYDGRLLETEHLRGLEAAHRSTAVDLSITIAPGLTGKLRALTERAMLTEMETPRTLKESIDLLRVGADAIAARPDGIELHGPFFWWLSKLGLMTPEKAMTPGTMAYQGESTTHWAGRGQHRLSAG